MLGGSFMERHRGVKRGERERMMMMVVVVVLRIVNGRHQLQHSGYLDISRANDFAASPAKFPH